MVGLKLKLRITVNLCPESVETRRDCETQASLGLEPALWTTKTPCCLVPCLVYHESPDTGSRAWLTALVTAIVLRISTLAVVCLSNKIG